MGAKRPAHASSIFVTFKMKSRISFSERNSDVRCKMRVLFGTRTYSMTAYLQWPIDGQPRDEYHHPPVRLPDSADYDRWQCQDHLDSGSGKE